MKFCGVTISKWCGQPIRKFMGIADNPIIDSDIATYVVEPTYSYRNITVIKNDIGDYDYATDVIVDYNKGNTPAPDSHIVVELQSQYTVTVMSQQSVSY